MNIYIFFSIYLILPGALGPGVHSASNRNEYQKQKNSVLGGVETKPLFKESSAVGFACKTVYRCINMRCPSSMLYSCSTYSWQSRKSCAVVRRVHSWKLRGVVVSHSFPSRASRRLKFSHNSILPCPEFHSTLVSMLELSPPLPILLLPRVGGLSALSTRAVPSWWTSYLGELALSLNSGIYRLPDPQTLCSW
jgi:hypothetical protein